MPVSQHTRVLGVGGALISIMMEVLPQKAKNLTAGQNKIDGYIAILPTAHTEQVIHFIPKLPKNIHCVISTYLIQIRIPGVLTVYPQMSAPPPWARGINAYFRQEENVFDPFPDKIYPVIECGEKSMLCQRNLVLK